MHPRSNVTVKEVFCKIAWKDFGRRQLLYKANSGNCCSGLVYIGSVLRSNPVTDFVKLRIGRPHFLVHYPCKLFVLFWYFGCLRPVRPQHQQTTEGFWSKTIFKSKELFGRTEESDQRQRLRTTFRARSNKIQNNRNWSTTMVAKFKSAQQQEQLLLVMAPWHRVVKSCDFNHLKLGMSRTYNSPLLFYQLRSIHNLA